MSDFDCNPLRYLGQSSVHSYGINVYASGGIPRESRFQNEYITEENTIFVQVDEKFYDLKNKSPSSRPSWCGPTRFSLADKNLLRYVEDSCDELDGYFDPIQLITTTVICACTVQTGSVDIVHVCRCEARRICCMMRTRL